LKRVQRGWGGGDAAVVVEAMVAEAVVSHISAII
jgi:hypothetical protein